MLGQDANYAIFTKRVKLQHEKKLLSNLLCMQSAGFEQKFMKFLEIFFPQVAISVAITGSSDVGYLDLYLIY